MAGVVPWPFMLSPVPRMGPIYMAAWLLGKADLHALAGLWLPSQVLDFGLREARAHFSLVGHSWSPSSGGFSGAVGLL
eukprot:5688018-Pyramimonas_sp.AAC.1